MFNLAQYIPFVNEQIAVQVKMAEKFKDEPWRKDLHLKSLAQYQSLIKDIDEASLYIKELEEKINNIPSKNISNKNSLHLSFEEIKHLPEELMKELSISETDRTEFIILDILEENGGIASLDRILIELYNKTKEIFKRTNLTARLYRMTQKGLLFSAPGKKGIYSTTEIKDGKLLVLSGTNYEEPQ